ncbi:NAD-dependent protein deacylase [Maribellus comscasis]|uniref:protein acetyllysine N-acetyltransferase n=1 Tax=Maribellus comscasis TaxID=2681766 RepID=A0A6I6JJZ0_9BACT|nr:NAD-dependent deacylase [Maribellus comscasis]QGY42601.1 NAD-dependent protein deacylase [Maribellus comscasis]
MDTAKLESAVKLIRKAKYTVAFTGAGISVASGIPPFRGKNGLWNKTSPIFLEIEFFNKKPLQSWKKIKEIFYDSLGDAEPNIAHEVLAKMEKRSFLESVITQNIDHLHQKAGSKYVYELHGTYKQLVCTECSSEYDMSFADLNYLPPTCYICKGILKPDMVFFNEPIPPFAKKRSFEEAEKADVFLIIGTNAEVLPAADIPVTAKKHGAKIIEINIKETHFTREITDVFLQGEAAEIMKQIGKLLYL